MGLKILHSADWHLDSPFSGYSQEQRDFLRREQRLLPGKIAALCKTEMCDLVLLSGDVFDGEATKESVDLVKTALADCAVPVVIAPGNHDFCGPGSPWLAELWPENVYIFTGGLDSVAIPGLDCRVWGAGYQSMDCPALLDGFWAEGNERYKLAVLHGDPVASNSPCCPVTAGQVRASGLQYLALGHIHKAGFFRAGQTLCGWPGSPMGRGWDETGEKGLYIVDVGEDTHLRFVPLDTPRFYEMEADIGTGANNALEAVLPAAGNPHFFRVTLTGSGEADIPALRRRFTRFPNLELRDGTEPALDVWADAGEDTLTGTYFRLLREAMEAEAPENRRHIALAAEISRKLLEGREVALP